MHFYAGKGEGELSEQQSLLEFFRKIWREEKGFVYLATKNPSTGEWGRKFFEWPLEEIPVVQTVLAERTRNEVYFAPAIFRERSSKKEHVLGSFCFWIEFDGTLPVEFEGLPDPSLIVQTSTETHQHIYWCVDSLVPVDHLESVNRSLTYQLGADASGWDANQVLRPPDTMNHKKSKPTKLIYQNERYVSSVAFSGILTEKIPPKIDIPEALPPPQQVVYKYQAQFTPELQNLFLKGVEKDRSAGLMRLGYTLAEMNMTNTEIMSLLLYADNTWGKFSKRNDQMQRLAEIVTKARQKYPYKTTSSQTETQIISVGDSTLISTEIKVDWLWEGIFPDPGYLLLTGHTGVGKSQFSLNLGAHIVLGKDFLDRKIATPRRVGFISLEMGITEVKYIRELQRSRLSEDEKRLLEKNLRYHILGYPLYLNRDENKVVIEEFIQREEIELLIFDSLGSMTEQELSKETDVKNLMDWNDHLKSELGISTLIIHHHRKAQTGNKRPNSISDIYGSHYITARASTVMIMWESPKRKGIIEVNAPKVRMSPPLSPFGIVRQNDLTFQASSDRIIIEDEVDVTDDEMPATPSINIFEDDDKGWNL